MTKLGLSPHSQIPIILTHLHTEISSPASPHKTSTTESRWVCLCLHISGVKKTGELCPTPGSRGGVWRKSRRIQLQFELSCWSLRARESGGGWGLPVCNHLDFIWTFKARQVIRHNKSGFVLDWKIQSVWQVEGRSSDASTSIILYLADEAPTWAQPAWFKHLNEIRH